MRPKVSSWFKERQQPARGGPERVAVDVFPSASYLVLAKLFFVAAMACSNGFAHALPGPWPQEMLEPVKLDVAWNGDFEASAVNGFHDFGAQWSDGRVELLALVSNESDVVASDKADEKRERVEKDRIDSSDGLKEWLQWAASPLLWLVFGLILGGAFERPRRR